MTAPIYCSARVTTVADQVEAELRVAGVPVRRRGAVRGTRPGTRASLGARRVPGRGFFGEATDADALDATLRGLVDRRVLRWAGDVPSPEARPPVYRFLHKCGVGVWVVVDE